MSGYRPASMIDSSLRDAASTWLEEDQDPETRRELEQLLASSDEETLADAFGERLQFGTAGLRGVLGPGPNRMNRVMIRRATAGLASYLIRTVPDVRERGVVIGRDARKKSDVFAEDTARIMLGAGIKVFFYEDIVPTPLVSFATTNLHAAAAIMVTASHNPPEYNGYKVFWETGGQIVPPHDSGISAEIDEIGRTDQLPMMELDAGRASGRLVDLGEQMLERYLEGLSTLAVHPEAPGGSGLVIAYTPLHGVGTPMTERAFSRAGFDGLHIVEEQREPDQRFSTVSFPNPEEPGAMDAVLDLGKRIGADIALASDPDADRLGVALPTSDGGWKLLEGDEIGVLLAHYLVTEGGGGSDCVVATSIVSSRMLKSLAHHHEIHYLDTLTGLKWIVDGALRHKSEHGSKIVLGYESALGYMVGELVHDKDGVSAAVVFAEMAAWAKQNGRTVWDLLDEACRLYGLFVTRTVSIFFPPSELHRVDELLTTMRSANLEKVGDRRVESFIDLEKDDIGLPRAATLLYELEGGARICVRPSGTEPKLKCYYEVKEPVSKDEPLERARARATAALDALVKAHQDLLAARKS